MLDLCPGEVLPHQVHKKGGAQRAVDHQAGIAFLVHGVIAIVVNAVTVKGQGRVTKQQHRIGNHFPTERSLGGRGHGQLRQDRERAPDLS